MIHEHDEFMDLDVGNCIGSGLEAWKEVVITWKPISGKFMVSDLRLRFEQGSRKICSKDRIPGPGALCAWCAPAARLWCAQSAPAARLNRPWFRSGRFRVARAQCRARLVRA